MNYCCNKGTYSPANETWTISSDLHRGNWDPFKGMAIPNSQFHRENYSGCGLHYPNYAVGATEWTVAGNITPGNSDPTANAWKYTNESYIPGGCMSKMGTYSTLSQTWSKQKMYQLG